MALSTKPLACLEGLGLTLLLVISAFHITAQSGRTALSSVRNHRVVEEASATAA